jgi:hypothetical protein
MANTIDNSLPVYKTATEAERLATLSVFSWWGTQAPKDDIYYHRIKSFFFPPPKFSPRR